MAVGSGIAHYNGEPIIEGTGIGLLVGVSPMLALGGLYSLIMWWQPDLPRCRCGKTKYGEYQYVGQMSEPFTEETWFENRCPKCGRRYKSKSGVFNEVLPDGTMVPYMETSRWGRWVVASEHHPPE